MFRQDVPAVKYFVSTRAFIVFVSLICILSGCGPSHYRQSADDEVYEIITEKAVDIEGMPSEFSVDRTEDASKASIAGVSDATVYLSLVDAIETAVNNSREYQSRMESLYLEGLSLTGARHEFDTIFSGGASTEVEKSGTKKSLSGGLSGGISKMLVTGGDLSASIATDFFRYISGGDPAEAAASALSVNLVQPLLRGSGKETALEGLTQAERDMTYAIRDFVRYRREFSVRTAGAYYNLLERADQVSNAYNNYQSLRFVRERSSEMSTAGRIPEFQVDQAEQNELSARDGWIRTIETYESAVDQFKLTIGMPVDTPLVPNKEDLDRLRKKGIAPLAMTIEEGTAVALENRLDLKTSKDKTDDQERKIVVAEQNLGTDLDLSLRYGRDTDNKAPLDFSDGEESYGAGLKLDLPLDRKSERNAYRTALISFEAAKRNYEASQDQVKLDVRNALRQLKQAEESYKIQLMSLDLAVRRAESTKLLQKAGRAITRDVLEAEEALLEAQNAVTSALVDHFNARLDLYLAMETLKIDDRGLWADEYGSDTNEEEKK